MNDERLEKMRKCILINASSTEQNTQKKSFISAFLWFIGCILLTALLVVQYTIFNINKLVKQPNAQKKLAIVCKILSCSLPSAELDNLYIDNVQHRRSKIGNSDKETDIIASVNNLSDSRQLYPNLKIMIHGVNGLSAELVLRPKDYLLLEKQTEMASSSENFFMLTIPINDDEISNIDITPFY